MCAVLDGWQVLAVTYIEILMGKVRFQFGKDTLGDFELHADLHALCQCVLTPGRVLIRCERMLGFICFWSLNVHFSLQMWPS